MIPHNNQQENIDAPNYSSYPPPPNMMPIFDPNMQYWAPMPPQYPPGYPPLSFKPAGNFNTNLSELLGLNDIFAEEFYPPGLNYSIYPTYASGYETSNDTGSNTNTEFADLFSARYEATQVRQPQSDYILKSRDNVILIPPTLPNNLPSMSTTTEQNYASSSSAFAIKTEPHSPCPSDIDDDHCDDNNPPRKTSRCDHSTNKHKSKATNPLPTDPHDLQMYQKIERRERNREHAKKSRVRKKVLLDTLQDQLLSLRRENMVLRRVVIDNIPQAAARILQECTTEESSLLLNNNISDTEDNDKPSHSSGPLSSSAYRPSRLTSNIAAGMRQSHTNTPTASSNLDPTVSSKLPYPSGFSFSNQVKQQAKILMEPDYRLIQSLVSSQQNFVLSDPSIPDNPIVYASEGFCKMTGYKKNDVLGRNCRFLQGPGTDQAAVDIIRKGITEGRDVSVCLLNYKADGKPFWNQFFLAALRDAEGQIVNYVGVQCEVNITPVHEIKDRIKRLPIPSDL